MPSFFASKCGSCGQQESAQYVLSLKCWISPLSVSGLLTFLASLHSQIAVLLFDVLHIYRSTTLDTVVSDSLFRGVCSVLELSTTGRAGKNHYLQRFLKGSFFAALFTPIVCDWFFCKERSQFSTVGALQKM